MRLTAHVRIPSTSTAGTGADARSPSLLHPDPAGGERADDRLRRARRGPQVLSLIREIATTEPAAVLITVRDLNLAAGPPTRRSCCTAGRYIDATVHYGSDGVLRLAATRSL